MLRLQGQPTLARTLVIAGKARDTRVGDLVACREKMYATARLIDEGSARLPVGVQVIAEPNREDRVLAVMQALKK